MTRIVWKVSTILLVIAMILIDCVIHGDMVDSETRCSFYVNSLKKSDIETLFPYQGKFHFRIKVGGDKLGLHNVDNVWLDISDDQRNLLTFFGGQVESVQIRALAVDLPPSTASPSAEYLAYLEDVNQSIGINPTDRPHRLAVEDMREKKSGQGLLNKIAKGVKKRTQTATQNITVESVAKGAASFWNTMKATASQIQQSLSQGASPLTDASEENLANLAGES